MYIYLCGEKRGVVSKGLCWPALCSTTLERSGKYDICIKNNRERKREKKRGRGRKTEGRRGEKDQQGFGVIESL